MAAGETRLPDHQVSHFGSLPVREVEISTLTLGYTPRHEGLDEDHVRSLLEDVGSVRPIIVHSSTMRVVDGAHRLEAYKRAGRTAIPAVLFKGSETDALFIAIHTNIKHGKPLTQLERRDAALEVIRQCPLLSDRWVAQVCGLSHTTIRGVREKAEKSSGPVRLGRDGRTRPIGPATTGTAVAKVLQDHPELSLRQVARQAGVSPATAQRTATRLASTSTSERPLPSKRRASQPRRRGGCDPQWLDRTAVCPRTTTVTSRSCHRTRSAREQVSASFVRLPGRPSQGPLHSP